MERICVFCGSSPGANPAYIQVARKLGRKIAEMKLTLVYGGGKVGLMGELAKTTLAAGGKVIGVIPEDLVKMSLAFTELTDLRIVSSMHERKALMSDLADAFIALPGGFGTIEEFFEVLTWAQLGLHQKACGLLNVCGYYDELIAFLDHILSEQFIQQVNHKMILVSEDIDELINKIETFRPEKTSKAAWALQMTQHDKG